MTKFISVDPGKDKCGLILADIDNNLVIEGRIVRASSVLDLVCLWKDSYAIELIIIGNGTGSKKWHSKLITAQSSPIEFVEEYGSTLRAKIRYFEMFPPSIFFKLIPKEMLLGPKNLDSLAALVLLEDYLEKKLDWPGEKSFKIWPL